MTLPRPSADEPVDGTASTTLGDVGRPGTANRRPGSAKRPGSRSGRPGTAGSQRPGTAGSVHGGTWMAGQMCLGAVQAAIDQAVNSDDSDASRVEQSMSDFEEDSFDPDHQAVRFKEGHSICSDGAPRSPSLMSVLGRSALFSPQKANRSMNADSPAPDSPSIIVIEQIPAIWTEHKPLPPKSPRAERPVQLGIPQPLSARGRERCADVQQPLSARYRQRSTRGRMGGA